MPPLDRFIPDQPTAEQCEANAIVHEDDHHVAYALWYPYMGGYGSMAVAICDKNWPADSGGCVDVFVWHDGDFPFHDGECPCELHLCNPYQFVEFGMALGKLNDALCADREALRKADECDDDDHLWACRVCGKAKE